jgi:hypothetical protein
MPRVAAIVVSFARARISSCLGSVLDAVDEGRRRLRIVRRSADVSALPSVRIVELGENAGSAPR